jgi:hypothetical protein
MDLPEFDPRHWTRTGRWAIEPREEAFARTPEFGRRFFEAVFSEFAGLSDSACFLRWSEQPKDVYAVFDRPDGGAGVQIDPVLEYIIVWGDDSRAEYGNWGIDQVRPAVDHVRRLLEGGRA